MSQNLTRQPRKAKFSLNLFQIELICPEICYLETAVNISPERELSEKYFEIVCSGTDCINKLAGKDWICPLHLTLVQVICLLVQIQQHQDSINLELILPPPKTGHPEMGVLQAHRRWLTALKRTDVNSLPF